MKRPDNWILFCFGFIFFSSLHPSYSVLLKRTFCFLIIMESLKMQFTPPEFYKTQLHSMNKLSPKLKPTISFTSSINIRAFCAASPTRTRTRTENPNQTKIIVPDRRRRVEASNAQLKENWLASLSYPFPGNTHLLNEDEEEQENEGSKWILGIDPDVSGAVALLKFHDSVCSAQVFVSLG